MKTIGDEVMIVSPDPVTLTEWAVGFLALFGERPQPRVGLHYGRAVYRDGDYFGTEVNLTHRVVARALGGEVMVTAAGRRRDRRLGLPRVRPDRPGRAEGLPEPVELFVVARARRTPEPTAAEAASAQESASARRTILAWSRRRRWRARRVRASGLIEPGTEAVVMISGGPIRPAPPPGWPACSAPSACTRCTSTTGCATGRRRRAHGRRLCAALRIDLHVERPAGEAATSRPRRAPSATTPPSGCATAPARGDRHRPHPHRRRRDRPLPARRLAGRAALLGLRRAAAASSGRCSALDRERVRELALAAGPAVRRRRVERRPELRAQPDPRRGLPALRDVKPEAEPNIAETRAELAEEAALLERVVLAGARRRRRRAGASRSRPTALAGWSRAAPAGAARARRARRRPQVPLGRGARRDQALARSRGRRVDSAAGSSPLRVASSLHRVRHRRAPRPPPSRSAARALARRATGRCAPSFTRRPSTRPAPSSRRSTRGARRRRSRCAPGAQGDRIRPLGMTGSKTLGDLFTDREVPRSQRRRLPVVHLGGRVAWVPGSPSPTSSGSRRRPSEVAADPPPHARGATRGAADGFCA